MKQQNSHTLSTDINIHTHTVCQHLKALCIINMTNFPVTLLSYDWTHTDPTAIHELGHHWSLQAFQEFWALAKFWLRDQGVNSRHLYHEIAYHLGPKHIKVLTSFTWNTPTKKIQLKSLLNKRIVSKPQSMQWSYKEAYNLMNWEDKTVEHLNIRLTKMVLKCGYPQDQVGTRKVEVMFSATKYFEIKIYWREQPLTLAYQALLDTWKIFGIL